MLRYFPPPRSANSSAAFVSSVLVPIIESEIPTMLERLFAVIGIVLASGCENQLAPRQPAAQNSRQVEHADVPLEEAEMNQAGQLPFKIVAVFEQQELTDEFPFHTNGGNWLFFDCQTGTASPVEFTVGVLIERDEKRSRVRSVLAVKDQEAGAEFLRLFAKSFPGKMPKRLSQAYSPPPLDINVYVFREGMSRNASSGFDAAGGGWTTAEWIARHDDRSAMIYFNYNLAEREGEFNENDIANDGENDAENANDRMAILASVLRDGPKPERIAGK